MTRSPDQLLTIVYTRSARLRRRRRLRSLAAAGAAVVVLAGLASSTTSTREESVGVVADQRDRYVDPDAPQTADQERDQAGSSGQDDAAQTRSPSDTRTKPPASVDRSRPAVPSASHPAPEQPALRGGGGAPVLYEQRNCFEVQSLFEVPPAAIQREVDPRFRPMRTSTGNVSLVLRTSTCSQTVVSRGWAEEPTSEALLGVEIEPPDGETRSRNLYILFFVSTNNDAVELLREGTGLGTRAVYVRDLSESWHDIPYRFSAPSPAPSPFVLEGVLSTSTAPLVNYKMAIWTEAEGGAMGLIGTSHIRYVGPADATVRPQPGSSMHKLVGDEARAMTATGDSSDYVQATKRLVACGMRCP